MEREGEVNCFHNSQLAACLVPSLQTFTNDVAGATLAGARQEKGPLRGLARSLPYLALILKPVQGGVSSFTQAGNTRWQRLDQGSQCEQRHLRSSRALVHRDKGLDQPPPTQHSCHWPDWSHALACQVEAMGEQWSWRLGSWVVHWPSCARRSHPPGHRSWQSRSGKRPPLGLQKRQQQWKQKEENDKASEKGDR